MFIKVKAFPNSKKESVVKESDDKFSVFVKDPAERNLANKRIVYLLSRYFEIPVGKVRIINGHRSSSKILSVDNE
jgi:uncharacterized protein YggU (UPF0235/DUF167 family)